MRELDKARTGNLFATPILTHTWADAAELNPALRAAILEHAARSPGVELTNYGGWHSEVGALEFCGEAGQRLIRHVLGMAEEATLRLYAEFERKPQFQGWTLSAWANINGPGDFNAMHTHPGATWSGVYYVDPGEAKTGGESTALHLSDPNPARTNLSFPELSNSNVLFNPERGLMILFPSYVPHAVLPHRGGGQRISIAFNLRKEPFP